MPNSQNVLAAHCRPAAHHQPPTENLDPLIASLQSEGQIRAAIVRPTTQPDTHPYEIVCGLRRHAAVTHLNTTNPEIPFRAEIRTLTDAEAFAIADQENRLRADIPDHQRALAYARALTQHFHGCQKEMASRIQLHPSQLSLYLSLAAMPAPILNAFGDHTRITITHAAKIAPCLKIPARAAPLLAAAKSLTDNQFTRGLAGHPYTAAATILHRLLAAAEPPGQLTRHTVLNDHGDVLATGHRTPKGTLLLHLPAQNPHLALSAAAEILKILAA